MKRKVRFLELARTGMFGKEGDTITKKDLKEVAETFAGKIPVILGHTVNYRTPKFGDVLDCWVSSDGSALMGCVSFSEEADKLYEAGKYDGWSVSIPWRAVDGKRYLHHLAILGAVPPKIPGLEELAQVEINFGDGDDAVKNRYQFSGHLKPEKEGNDTMTEEEKKAMAEKDAKIAELEAQKKALEEQAASNKEAAQSAPPSAATPAADAKQDAPAQADATDDAKFADMQREVSELKEARRKERLDGFGQRIAGKLPAGVASKAKALAEKIEVVGSFDFADNGKTEKRDALQLFEDIIKTWPQSVKPGASGINYADFANSGFNSGSEQINWSAAAKKM